MTTVKYELEDGTRVSSLQSALDSGMEFTKVYNETYPWGEDVDVYETNDWGYARRRCSE